MDPELKKFEEELERLCPVAMPDGLIARMESAMDRWQEEAAEEKVVPFPGREENAYGASRGGFWAAAAAVALLGALAALLVPDKGGYAGSEQLATSDAAVPALAPASFSPVGASRNILAASDEGFVMTRDAVPHRAVRVEYTDLVEFTNERGERLQLEAPRVRIVLIPVQVD